MYGSEGYLLPTNVLGKGRPFDNCREFYHQEVCPWNRRDERSMTVISGSRRSSLSNGLNSASPLRRTGRDMHFTFSAAIASQCTLSVSYFHPCVPAFSPYSL